MTVLNRNPWEDQKEKQSNMKKKERKFPGVVILGVKKCGTTTVGNTFCIIWFPKGTFLKLSYSSSLSAKHAPWAGSRGWWL